MAWKGLSTVTGGEQAANASIPLCCRRGTFRPFDCERKVVLIFLPQSRQPGALLRRRHLPKAGAPQSVTGRPYLFLCRSAFMRLRYLCFDIFFLRFFLTDPTGTSCFRYQYATE